MNYLLFSVFVLIAAYYFYLFLAGKFSTSPLWLMLSVWALGLGIPQLHLSDLEAAWSREFWLSIAASLICFSAGFFLFNWLWQKFPFWKKFGLLNRGTVKVGVLRLVLYFLLAVSVGALYLFYRKAGNFPLLAPDTDVFRFKADEQVPGLINYLAQLARLYIPLGFFLMFWEGFKLKKHWDLVIIALFGTACLTLFASRTQIFFIDLWIMALYLLIRKPNIRQALKFYPFFLIVSVAVLAAVPLFRQAKSYGSTDYLANVTAVKVSGENPAAKFFVPIYVGVSFNMQALLHAQQYYQVYPLQHGRVLFDPFTNILGLHQFKPNFDLGEIFYYWWNTGTYLFPFVQDFGNYAFYVIPFLIAGILTLSWQYWRSSPNFLSLNLYAYACFFMVMTIYLSFTVRAEMYIDLFLMFAIYFAVTRKGLSYA